MLSTGGMLVTRASSPAGTTMIVATETGMLHPLEMAAPGQALHPREPAAVCKYMKMITLPKLRDVLREMRPEVRVDPETVAERARVPIERMVAITRQRHGGPRGPPWPMNLANELRGQPTRSIFRKTAPALVTSSSASWTTAPSFSAPGGQDCVSRSLSPPWLSPWPSVLSPLLWLSPPSLCRKRLCVPS